MQVSKDDYYAKVTAYGQEHKLEIGCKSSGQNKIFYPYADKNTYAPIAEIRLESIEVDGKFGYEYFYYILPSIDKKPKKVKI